MVQAVVAPAGRDPAAPVATMVERDDAVVLCQIGDLVRPHPDGAGDAVREHDRVAILGTEDLGVQLGAVLRADGHPAAGPQLPGRGEGAAGRAGLLTTSHTYSDRSLQRRRGLAVYRSVISPARTAAAGGKDVGC